MASIDDVVIVRNNEGFDPLAFRDVVKQTREAAAAVTAELQAKQAEAPPEPTPAPAKVKRTRTRTPRDRALPDLRSFALVRRIEALFDRSANVLVRVAAVAAVAMLAWSFRSNVESLIRYLVLPDRGETAANAQPGERGTGSLISERSGATDSVTGGSTAPTEEGTADRSGTEALWADQGRLGDGEPGGVGEPESGPSRIDWGDDGTYFVVDTARAMSIDEGAPTAPLPEDPSSPSVAVPPPVAETPPPAEPNGGVPTGPTEVVRADGSIDTVSVPAQSLEFALPTADERTIMSAYPSDEVSPFVVVDPDGAIGDPDLRYVRTNGRLIETGVVDGSTTESAPTSEPVTAAVDLGAGLDEQEAIRQLAALPGVRDVRRVGPGLLQVVTDGATTSLTAVAGVDGVSPDLLLGYASTSGPVGTFAGTAPPPTADDSAPLQMAPTRRLRHPIVAVIDSGFDRTHPELVGQWWSNVDEDCLNGADDDRNGFVDDCAGWDFGRGDTDVSPEPDDPWREHGNMVASVVAASRDGYGITGVAPDATVMPLKVARSNGTVPMSAVAAALRYAVDNGADVVNISLITQTGVERSAVRVLEEAVAQAEAAGVMVVTGAGNESRNLTLTPAWPASFSTRYPNVITVGASVDHRGQAPFTNLGDAISVWAPGVSVATARGTGEIVLSTGSSYAAPAVAGMLAEQVAIDGRSDPEDQRRRLVAAATKVAGGNHLPSTTRRDTPVGSINLVEPPKATPEAESGYWGWRRYGW